MLNERERQGERAGVRLGLEQSPWARPRPFTHAVLVYAPAGTGSTP
jgi:hypothetical protein